MSSPNTSESDDQSASQHTFRIVRTGSGYVYVFDRNNEADEADDDDDSVDALALHHLIAIADGVDPSDLWEDDYEIHHRGGVKIDMPSGLEALKPSEHHQCHRDELDDPAEFLEAS